MEMVRYWEGISSCCLDLYGFLYVGESSGAADVPMPNTGMRIQVQIIRSARTFYSVHIQGIIQRALAVAGHMGEKL
jgi:hypothetical protein